MSENTVLYRVESGIAHITLNRPERYNALTRQLLLDLGPAIDNAAADDAVRVISLTGSGRGFCAGQDLSERDPRKLDGPLDLAAIQRELYHPVIRTLNETPKPVAACVNGIAVGAGAGLALAADIVLAAESASLAFSFARIGLAADAGVGRALINALGMPRAKAILMLGETLTADEAQRCGLIWRTVADGDLGREYQTLLNKLAATPRASLAGFKSALASAHLTLPDYLEIEADAQGRAGRNPDYAEGVLAFLEKRKPDFS
jgi:2-(1,2-epoxy-1,2-dihydrophenyl)acetyl-CoA isomerase